MAVAENKTRFVLSQNPPWYNLLCKWVKNPFVCKNPQGLYVEVAKRMLAETKVIRWNQSSKTAWKDTNVINQVREKIFSQSLEQGPSRSLLAAVMDLVEIQGGNRLRCVSTDTDRAGAKHQLLMRHNFTTFYIPSKEFYKSDKIVVPVVTQYAKEENLWYINRNKSMLGSYVVFIEYGERSSYFIQEVLVVPGLESLKVLRDVAELAFDFWDLALEMPTHQQALTPAFAQIQASQLLPLPSDREDVETADGFEQIRPMCCIANVPQGLRQELEKKSGAPADWLGESQVKANLQPGLACFEAEDQHVKKVVYFRSRGKRENLLPVVDERHAAAAEDRPTDGGKQLYVSTTHRLLSSIEHMAIKGNGNISWGHEKLIQELGKIDSFMHGPDLHEKLYSCALKVVAKRVNSASWTGFIMPEYLDNMVADPVRNEIVNLGIRLMNHKIPRAFAVAELMHCPLEDVQKYLSWWQRCESDKKLYCAAKQHGVAMLKNRMATHWRKLQQVGETYGKIKFNDVAEQGIDPAREMAKWAELFGSKAQTMDNAKQALRMWYALNFSVKVKVKPSKEAVACLINAKLLMYKLNEDRANVMKELKNGGEGSSEDDRDNESTDDDGSDKASDKEDHAPHDASMYSLLLPQDVPPGTWVQNLSYLLTNSTWLYKETVRREAVCVLLGMNSTLLHKKNVRHLDKWVSVNLDLMSKYNIKLTDRLSVALIASYKRVMSRMDDWCCELEQLIAGDPGKRSPPLSMSEPERRKQQEAHGKASSKTSKEAKYRQVSSGGNASRNRETGKVQLSSFSGTKGKNQLVSLRSNYDSDFEDDDNKRYYKQDKSDEEDNSDDIEDETNSTSMKLICEEDLSETETPRNSQEARVERPRSSDSKGKSKQVLKHTEARRKTPKAKRKDMKKSLVSKQLARKQKSKACKRPRSSSCDRDGPAALPVKKQKKETSESCPSHTQMYKLLVSEKDKEREGRKLGSSDSEDEGKREQGSRRTVGEDEDISSDEAERGRGEEFMPAKFSDGGGHI